MSTNNNNSEEGATATVEPPAATTATTFACDKCERTFDSPTGLKIHHLRAHEGRHWSRTPKVVASPAKVKTKAKAVVKAKKAKAKAKEATAVASPDTSGSPQAHCDVEFCPRCGFQVGDVSRAISVLTDMTTAGGSLAYHVDIKGGGGHNGH